MQPFVLHTHFYQPERANPWTGVLEPEPSAAPDRDWNERIHRESYRANAVARIFDGHRRVEEIVNTYEWLSFNFGPTLLAWMEQTHPETYRRILAADRASHTRTGHGNALAQAFHHTILPLANDRDRRTQVHWGLADFRHRFGREAEGLWLPETAADAATIDALIDAGVRYTVLAPGQAGAVRGTDGAWRDTGGRIDPSRPYRLTHSDGSGRSLAGFFYDGDLAQGFAFDPGRMDAGAMTRAIAGASRGSGLVHAAMDGETFGHHHRFGELGLAYMLARSGPAAGLAPTNYGAYLAEHPPTEDVTLVPGEGSAWSCAHGVGRWIRDCGCSTNAHGGWDQAWRGPLRYALDLLRDAAGDRFADLAGEVLTDPWAAREDYVEVLVGAQDREAFVAEHARRRLSAQRTADLWTLLESQRNAMAMYTSCGWFFADVSGIETVYVLRFAARVLDLLDDLGAPGPRGAFLDALGEARSNVAGIGSAVDVWHERVLPDAVSPERVAAHVGLSAATGDPESTLPAGHDVEVSDLRHDSGGRITLATARVAVTPEATRRVHRFVVAGTHLGGLDLQAVVAPDRGDGAYEQALGTIWQARADVPLARFLRTLDGALDGQEFALEAALPEARQRLVAAVSRELEARFGASYARLYADHRRTLEMLRASGYELPPVLRAAAELTLTRELADRIASARHSASALGSPADFAGISELIAYARHQGFELDVEPVRATLEEILEIATRRACASLAPRDAEHVGRWLELADQLSVVLDTARPQEHVYELAPVVADGKLDAEAVEVLAGLGERLGLAPRLLERRSSAA